MGVVADTFHDWYEPTIKEEKARVAEWHRKSRELVRMKELRKALAAEGTPESRS